MKQSVARAGLPVADEILSAAEVAAGFASLAGSIQPYIDKGNCVLLGVLFGGLYPLTRLADRLTGDFMLDYCHATRYGGGTSGGDLEWHAEPRLEFTGRTVFVVDDIYDEGRTLQAVASYCREKGAQLVLTVAMVVKQRARDGALPPPDFTTGLTVPDRYVFGCGMDLYGHWRHLPAIYALREDSEPAGVFRG